MTWARLWRVLLCGVIVVAGCASVPLTQTEVLTALANDTVIPQFRALEQQTAALASAVDDVCGNPSPATLDAAHEQVRTVRYTWSASTPMWFGVVMKRRSWGLIEWPADGDDIESLLANPKMNMTVDDLKRKIAADQRGLGAIEYMLGEPNSPAKVISALGGGRRCAYLTAIAQIVATESAAVTHGWVTDLDDNGPYLATFAEPTEDGVGQVVNDALFLLNAMSDAELGKALGDTGKAPDDSMLLEGAAGLGVADMVAHLDGLRSVLIGGAVAHSRGEADARGLAPLLSDDLVTRLDTAFDAATEALESIDGPLRAAIAERPASVSAARGRLQEVQRLVATEVVSELGVTIGFSDADGDSG